jgi:hypothetical protein
MNLTEGIKQKGTPAIIRDCPRDNLPQFLVEQGYKVGAEIGVYKGAFTSRFCQAGLKMFAVDPWIAFTGQGRSQHKQEVQDELFDIAQQTLKPYTDSGQCQIIRRTSVSAIPKFRHESLDFVYIDGCHEFPNVAQDIYEWSKIVRKGGIISGHDYFNTPPHASNVLCHAKAAVDAYTVLYQIDNWWIFGNPKYYSWMWFKP